MAFPSRTPSPTPTPEGDVDHTVRGAAGPSDEAHGDGRRARSDPGEVDEIVQELEDRLRWVSADLENLRNRYDREILRERLAERARVVGEWLPVIDNLDLALQHLDETADTASRAVIAGVAAVRDQAIGVLERLGFVRYDDLGKPFDPSRHEAVGTIESDAPDRTIVAVVRPGYRNGDDVLRPASVVVAHRSATSGNDSGTPDSEGSVSRGPA